MQLRKFRNGSAILGSVLGVVSGATLSTIETVVSAVTDLEVVPVKTTIGCDGNVHHSCANVSSAELRLISKKKNFVFVCDDCLEDVPINNDSCDSSPNPTAGPKVISKPKSKEQPEPKSTGPKTSGNEDDGFKTVTRKKKRGRAQPEGGTIGKRTVKTLAKTSTGYGMGYAGAIGGTMVASTVVGGCTGTIGSVVAGTAIATSIGTATGAMAGTAIGGSVGVLLGGVGAIPLGVAGAYVGGMVGGLVVGMAGSAVVGTVANKINNEMSIFSDFGKH
ncbi:hypothetical protein B566_EDAN017005 [Ephemera danica]|nr:hypothetical protein B566_EDAN017005 [Ephemera danica]